jgi:hypothetical protein
MKTISPIHAAFLGALLATSINAAAACSAHTDCTSGQYCYDAGFYDNGIWSGVGVCSDYPSHCCSGVDADPIDQNTCACPAASACSECFDLFDTDGSIPAFDTYGSPDATGHECLKITAILDGSSGVGDSDVMSGIFTLADGNTIDATSYSSVAAFTADATAKVVPGSLCSYTDFTSSNTCVRTVSNLDPTVTYNLGAVNKDVTNAQVIRLGITTCTYSGECSAHTDCTSGQYCYDAGFYDNGIWSGEGVCSDYPSNCCSGVDADPIDQNTCACPAASACSECFDLFDESGYIPAFDIYEGPQGTNFACLKTTAMLDGPPELLYSGEGNVMSGIFTVADGNTIDATSYSSVAAFTADATAKAVPGSICSYTDFVSSNTCVRTVSNLDPTVTYVYGAVNKDETGAKVARLGITTCTSAASFAKPFVVLYAISALVSLFV